MNNTVADLVTLLQTLPQDMVVVQARDGEGNGFSPWSGDHYVSHYEADSTWSGELRDPDEVGLDGKTPYYDEEEREQYRKLPQVVVLWPVN